METREGSADLHLRIRAAAFRARLSGRMARAARPRRALRRYVSPAFAASGGRGGWSGRVLFADAHGDPACSSADSEGPQCESECATVLLWAVRAHERALPASAGRCDDTGRRV